MQIIGQYISVITVKTVKGGGKIFSFKIDCVLEFVFDIGIVDCFSVIIIVFW